MGILFSRFKKAKAEQTALEKLAKIESQIRSLDESIQQDRRREKRIWAGFLFITIFLYVSVASILHMFILQRVTVVDYAKLTLIWITPVFLIYFLQRWIPWYFERGIQVNRDKLLKLRQEKKKILDDVRENEPYNKAKAILEKYEGPQVAPRGSVPSVPSQPQVRPNSNVSLTKMPVGPFPGPPPPRPPGPQPRPGANNFNAPYPPYQQLSYGRPPQNKRRSAMDRMLDFVVKDGPENRMALICRNCGAHNGLVLLDEFEYTGFKCFECHMPNPSRKPRPVMSRPSMSAEIRPLGSPGSFPLTGSLDNQSGSSSSSEEEEDETTATRIASEEPSTHQATVKSPATVIHHEEMPRSSQATMIDPSLAESDTGSESDVEDEGSQRDSSPMPAQPAETERPTVVA